MYEKSTHMKKLGLAIEHLSKKHIISCIIFFGIVFRIFHFFYNRSLWIDELYLSSGLLHMGYLDLATTTLDYQQKAPILFLWLVKFSLILFGNNEMALRFVPLIAGILSLFAFNNLIRLLLKPNSQILALAIFSFAPAIIYHSVEIKQYSMECLITILILYTFIRHKDSTSWADHILLALYGSVAVWFSYPIIFILTGIGAGTVLISLRKQEWKQFSKMAIVFLFWAISFLINYYFFTIRHTESKWVVYWFKVYENFMPFPPLNFHEIMWFPRNFLQMLDYPLGLIWSIDSFKSITLKIVTALIPSSLLLIGFYSLFNSKKRLFLILTLPLVFMLLASGLYLYPLLERFWLFVTPILILVIAMGYEYVKEQITIRKYSFIILVLTASCPALQAIYFLIEPDLFYKHKKSYQKEALMTINNNIKHGDVVYNYWNNYPGYSVYKQMYNFKFNAIEGDDYRFVSKDQYDYNQRINSALNEVSKKKVKRIWLIFNTQILSNIGDKIDYPKWYYKSNIPPAENIVKEFLKHGKLIKKLNYSDISVYLIQLAPS